ncbi:MAG: dihydrofolate reductase [Pyrinomonadaceae bacterium]
MAIIGIVAVDRSGAIGKGGRVPWHYPADLRFFKEQTVGHVCVMGRRTWASLKRPLPNRLNVVLSRTPEAETQPGVLWLRDKTSVLSLLPYLSCDLYVIGGEQLYQSFLPEIERWVVTEIPLSVEDADTFMPAEFLHGFRQSGARELDADLKAVFYRREH